jgi:hypothetical protein
MIVELRYDKEELIKKFSGLLSRGEAVCIGKVPAGATITACDASGDSVVIKYTHNGEDNIGHDKDISSSMLCSAPPRSQ